MSLTYAGMVSGNYCQHLVEKLHDFATFASAVIVRSIDSTVLPKDIDQVLKRNEISLTPECELSVISLEQYWKAVQANLFTGFDELWFVGSAKVFQQSRGWEDRLSTLTTMKYDRLPLSYPPSESEWGSDKLATLAQEMGLQLALSDGIGLGLHVLCFSSGLAPHVEKIMIQLDREV